MTFEISDDAKQAMSGPLGEGEGIRLPFSAAVFYAINGDPKLSQVGGVPYFGGWASSQEELVGHMHSMGLEIPASLVLMQFNGRDGDYFAYTTRSVAIAPIAYRKRNIGENGKYREHLQLLGYGLIANKEGKHDLGPIVLSAKGWQSANVKKAMGAWERASAEARRPSGVDSKFFFLPIGTFGDKPDFVLVGKGEQSKITPLAPQIPDPVTEEHLRGRFVGKEIADKMAEMKRQAQEWLNDKKWLRVDTSEATQDLPPVDDNDYAGPNDF